MKRNKNKLNLLASAIFILTLIGFASCDKNDEGDTTPPGKLVINGIVPTHGGAKIAFTLPADKDLLYVKAEYTTTVGKNVFKASSYYNDTIELDGFNDTTPQTIKLYVVDRNNNKSEAVETKVTPLLSYIHLVQESLNVIPTFGGVKIAWQNIMKKSVHVKIYAESLYGLDSVIISTDLENYATTFRGLDSVNYEFYSLVEDNHENTTLKQYVATVKPAFEQKIDKSSWTLIPGLSVDGNAWEGVTENFWDDVIDTNTDPDDNSYFIISRDDNGGALNYPLDIVIDLNKQVIINRVQVWQRAYWYSGDEPNGVSALPYYYQPENMRKFELWVSNDKITWEIAGAFDIGDPKDDDGNIAPEYIQAAIDGHEFILENATEPFRYLKYSITSTFGSETNVYGSEITLYGLDNVEK